MPQSKYLIVGSSHAGLSALETIRLSDPEGGITLLSEESTFPYSPTILPYVVSGKAKPERVFLRDEETFKQLGVTFKMNSRVVEVDPKKHIVRVETGQTWEYEKLLLATGGTPNRPNIEGLETVSYHTLRSLHDANRLRASIKKAREGIVLGAGLIGMHVAENLAKSGLKITVIEAREQALPGYFDVKAADMIAKLFSQEGIQILTGEKVERVTERVGRYELYLSSGGTVSGDLLFVSTGTKPRIEYLNGSAIAVQDGILVSDQMRTSLEGVWAAGDVAQARWFFGNSKKLNPTLTNAVEQGRIAGGDMAGDPALKPYPGGMVANTYRFFDNSAFAIGLCGPLTEDDFEVNQIFLPSSFFYQKLVFKDDYLVGAFGINTDLDPGILYQLIRRRVSLGKEKSRLSANPLETARILMTQIWR